MAGDLELPLLPAGQKVLGTDRMMDLCVIPGWKCQTEPSGEP